MGRLYKYTFTSPTIRCANCISPYLNKLKLATFWDQSEKNAMYVYSDHADHAKALQEAGFKGLKALEINQPAQQKSNKSDYILAALALSIAGIVWFLPMLISLSPLFLGLLGGCATILTLWLGMPAYKNMFKSWSMDTLFGLSSIIALTASILGLFIPGLPIMFEVGLMVFGFQKLGSAIRNAATQKLTAQVYYRNRFDATVFAYKVDEIISIKPDQIIPIDFTIIESAANAYLDSTIIDGQNYKIINAEEDIRAGHVVRGGEVKVKVTKRYLDSHLNKMDMALILAQCKQANSNQETYKWLKNFIIGVCILAIVSGILVSIFFSPIMAIHTAVSVLVAACPCTMALINPLTLKLGQHFLGREGIAVGNLRAIENIDKIDKVFFDLTGTLTEGKLEVIDASQNKDNFYAIANKLEQESNHPVAVAIKNYTNDADVVTTDCKIGNAKQLGIDYQGTEHRIYVKQKDNVLGFFVVKDKLRKNAQELIREIRETKIKNIAILSGAPQAVVDSYKTELNVQEVHGGVINKDEIIVQEVHGDVINKDEIINKYQTTNHSIARSASDAANHKDVIARSASDVANHKDVIARSTSDVAIHNAMMVGDAPNDRSAMQTSKIGVFVGKDDANISGCYDVKLNSIAQLPKFIDISKRVKNHMKQNLIISITYNVIMLVIASGALLAYGIMMPPVLCAGLMILQSLFVLLNTYRFSLSMQSKQAPPKNCMPILNHSEACLNVLRKQQDNSSQLQHL